MDNSDIKINVMKYSDKTGKFTPTADRHLPVICPQKEWTP